jgi:opacity protein-like surface antigen
MLEPPAQHHYFYTATVGASASARLTDFGTLRARAGIAFDNFLPYAYVGAALGRVDIMRSASVSYTRHDIPDVVAPPTGPLTPIPDFTYGPQAQQEIKSTLAYGYAIGLGIDIALMQNVFVRAEAEYLQFAPVEAIKIHVNSGRIAVGVKF